MKNYIKKMIIMFVMIVGIIGNYSINALAADDFEIGINNLNNTTDNSAKIGDVLKNPEKGWKRYDDTMIQHSDGLSNNSNSWFNASAHNSNYKSTITDMIYEADTKDEYFMFNFKGTKLRIISPYWWSCATEIDIYIDDILVDSFSECSSKDAFQTLVYEIQGLSEKEHAVKIVHASSENSYFCIDAVDIDEDGTILPYSEKFTETILNIEPEEDMIFLNENIQCNVTIENIKEIAAEDMIIKYDSTKLKLLGTEQVDGIKVVKDEENEDQLRIILASQGANNIVNNKKVLLKLKFQGIAVGDALVDITKGKISDGIEMERDLTEKECGQAIITIDDYKDVNRNGEFTLLDLAIDGRHYGKNPSDFPQYITDIVENDAIDDDDLLQIGQYMIENPNYKFN